MFPIVALWKTREISEMIQEKMTASRKKTVIGGKKAAVHIAPIERMIIITVMIAVVAAVIAVKMIAITGKALVTKEIVQAIIEEMTRTPTKEMILMGDQVDQILTTEENLEINVLKMTAIEAGKTVIFVDLVEENGIEGRTMPSEVGLVSGVKMMMMKDEMIHQGRSMDLFCSFVHFYSFKFIAPMH